MTYLLYIICIGLLVAPLLIQKQITQGRLCPLNHGRIYCFFANVGVDKWRNVRHVFSKSV